MRSEAAETQDSATALAGTRTELDSAWRQFGSARSPEEFCRHWLAVQCHAIAEVHQAVVVLQKPGAEAFAPIAAWPEGARERSVGEIAERALREGRGLVEGRDNEAYQIAYPVRLDGAVRGVVALEIAWREAAELQAAMRQLQWGAGWLEVLLRRQADPGETARLRIKLIMQLVSSFLERPTLKEAATDLAAEVASRLGCDRVVLGVWQGRALRVEAVSHSVQFDPHSNLLGAIVAAMVEAIDQRETIVFPQDGEARPVVTFAHAELAQLSGAGGILSVPLLHNGAVVGALSLERAAGLPFDPPAIELAGGLASMLGPLVHLHLQQQKTLPSNVAATTRNFWSRLVGPRNAGLKFAAGAAVLLLAFLVLASGAYRISATARVEGEIQRALTAPFQGYVREAPRRAGDVVKKGELLARLDDRDLRLERTRLASQAEQYGRQYREAMAKRDRASARIVSAQTDQVGAQLALIDEQLSRTDIAAPFDGVLVSGDLSQALGAPIERGQMLFEIAPLDAYRVVLQVDEHRVADLKAGQRGELVLSSMPGERYPMTVSKITPVSTAREGRNFFRVEAQLQPDDAARLRPGMEGVAKVTVDDRLLAWIWTRELANWVRLKAWTWTP
ncbi:MAG TPA: HlyD family efflux transporter periplasmic adaptor subunit [Burkholderiales bacterium]|nr:HlyD family efflux transporter periplasmic adaptor subunit [Burkholderiales bacterium]